MTTVRVRLYIKFNNALVQPLPTTGRQIVKTTEEGCYAVGPGVTPPPLWCKCDCTYFLRLCLSARARSFHPLVTFRYKSFYMLQIHFLRVCCKYPCLYKAVLFTLPCRQQCSIDDRFRALIRPVFRPPAFRPASSG